MASSRTVAKQLPSLTGLRFLAAAMVFVFHGATTFVFADQKAGLDYLFGVSGFGAIGVSFFFVLSGFVLTWSAREGDTTLRFWRRRFLKIFPNHAVTFVAAVVLVAVAGQTMGLWETVSSFFLVQGWVPQYSFLNGGNPVSWSLSAEALFYLAFPLLIVAAKRINPNRLWYWAAGLMAATVAVPAFSLNVLPSTPVFPWGPASWVQIWFVSYFPLTRMLEFALGILLARIVLNGKWFRLPVLPALVLGVGGYLALLYLPVNFLYTYVATLILPIALIIPAVASADISGRRSLLRTRPMVYLGNISFAFYLVHYLVLTYGHLAFGNQLGPMGAPAGPQWSILGGSLFLTGCFVTSLVLAAALYTFVERPIMQRWARTRTTPAAVPSTPVAATAVPERALVPADV